MAEKENLTFGAMVCLKVVRRLASLTWEESDQYEPAA
jgi:hypothetical protein